MSNTFKYLKKNPIYLYYLILLLIVTFRAEMSPPSVLLRICFLIAFFTPILFKYRRLYPAIIICFSTVSVYGFSFNFLPYEDYIYTLITLFGFLLIKDRPRIHYSFLIITVIILTAVINLFYAGRLENFNYSLITIFLLAYFIPKYNEENSNLLLNCFCFISLCLSIIYLLNYQKFLVSYNEAEGLERGGWTDPNYLSCIIGMGVITSLVQIMSTKKKSSLFELSFWYATIGLSLVSQIMLASRGGLLAVGVSMFILLIFSKTKLRYKILTLVAISIFLLWLYENGYFKLIEYRMNHDTGQGSGRTEIWLSKFSDFEKYTVIEWLIGIGFEMSTKLGFYSQYGGGAFGFHNDFLALLCNYGIVGLVLFFSAMVMPLRVVGKENRIYVLAFIIYLMTTCMTLEPFSAGRLPYFGFYLMIVVYAKSLSQKNEKNSVCNSTFGRRRYKFLS